MRCAYLMGMLILAGCASDKLASAPPAGVNFAGRWQLNLADSDDPQRVLAAQLGGVTANGATPARKQPASSQSSRAGMAGMMGPSSPGVAVLDESLRWPGKIVIIQQTGGVVTFDSDGGVRVCRPGAAPGQHQHPKEDPYHGRENMGRGDVPPPRCGWEDRTLVVQSGDPEDQQPPYEQRFSMSDDGTRLVELVLFKNGRSAGYTATREWERQAAP
jgi:hypothetical protein